MRFIIVISLVLSALSAEPREALLIGNHTYKHIINLDDPLSDLKQLEKILEDLDFNVNIKTDLNSEKLEESIDLFAKRLLKNSDSIGFVYYTGHGCQVDYQGYLVPTNVDTKIKRKIKYNALNINEMLETLKDAGNRVNMVFLDACRDVPTGTKGGTKGLGQPLEKPIGTLLVYATEAGKVANDNAKFINALIDNISKPNQYIKDIGDNISRVVAKESSFKQIPEVFSKLLPERMVLKGGYVVPPEPIVTINGLMYQNQPFTKEYTWQEAKGYCQGLTLGGYDNWRFPNRKELKKLVTKNEIQGQKYKYYIRSEFVKNLRSYAYFWTSEEKDSSNAWNVLFGSGYDSWYLKTSNSYALCVR